MRAQRRPRGAPYGARPSRRRAVSLLELLLVLALLVIIAAMALPALQRPLENHRLRKAADVVRVQWARARVKAIETGRTFVFRYQPNTGQCVIEPWQADDDYLESSDMSAAAPTPSGGGIAAGLAMPSGSSVNPASTTATSTVETTELPEGVTIVSSASETDEREMLLAGSMMGGAASGGLVADPLGGGTWSAPIFFYPDGSSSTAQLLLMNTRHNYIALSLRGLTGVVKVSDLLTMNELQ